MSAEAGFTHSASLKSLLHEVVTWSSWAYRLAALILTCHLPHHHRSVFTSASSVPAESSTCSATWAPQGALSHRCSSMTSHCFIKHAFESRSDTLDAPPVPHWTVFLAIYPHNTTTDRGPTVTEYFNFCFKPIFHFQTIFFFFAFLHKWKNSLKVKMDF